MGLGRGGIAGEGNTTLFVSFSSFLPFSRISVFDVEIKSQNKISTLVLEFSKKSTLQPLTYLHLGWDLTVRFDLI